MKARGGAGTRGYFFIIDRIRNATPTPDPRRRDGAGAMPTSQIGAGDT